MSNRQISHFMGLIMHQPAGNLHSLLERGGKEANDARQILLAYQRPLDYAERYQSEARFCVCFSGVLLEQLEDPLLARRCASFVDIPRMLARYREADNIEFAATGYYHPVFPLIPEADWDDHIERGRDKVREVLGRSPTIFWPPEMGFTTAMIPRLTRLGFRYVLCDGDHLVPNAEHILHDENGEKSNIYGAYIVKYANDSIVVVPRDGYLSGAQFGGTKPEWFGRTAVERVAGCVPPVLVTTWTDGENGGWFRIEDEKQQFWGQFFAPYMEQVRCGRSLLRPVALSEFIAENLPRFKGSVRAGTWNYVHSQPDSSFKRWTGLPDQDAARDEIARVSQRFWSVQWPADGLLDGAKSAKREAVRKEILFAEASDNLYDENCWTHKIWSALGRAEALLKEFD